MGFPRSLLRDRTALQHLGRSRAGLGLESVSNRHRNTMALESMEIAISSALYGCQTPRHQLDAGDVEPSHRALDGGFNILCQAAIAVEPGNGALHHPTPRQENEALGRVGALDDLDGP